MALFSYLFLSRSQQLQSPKGRTRGKVGQSVFHPVFPIEINGLGKGVWIWGGAFGSRKRLT